MKAIKLPDITYDFWLSTGGWSIYTADVLWGFDCFLIEEKDLFSALYLLWICGKKNLKDQRRAGGYPYIEGQITTSSAS